MSAKKSIYSSQDASIFVPTISKQGRRINEQIKTGEFFGVKSSLGKYPREETAMVLSDSTMLVFSVPEFEQVVLKNTRIIMKMLKVFSNQLRRIHQQVQNLISTSDSETDPEDGLFSDR